MSRRLILPSITDFGACRVGEGEGGGGAPPAPTPPATPPAAPTPPAPTPPAEPDKGFPEGTPLADMTPDQRAAYWQDKARKHEDRVKALGVTPEQLADLRAKAKRSEDLDYELASATDKAVADATKAAEAAAAAKYQPALVDAEFRAAAAGRLEPDKLTTILGPLDKSWFLAADGTVDTAKVSAYVDGIAPAKGSTPPPKGPGITGLGNRVGTPGAASVASGRELYAQMHPKRAAG